MFIILLLSTFISLPLLNAKSFAQTVAEKLSVIDKSQHSKEQFQTIINILKKHHPDITEDEISGLIYYAYQRLQTDFPDISLYDVASGILESSKILVGQKITLREIVALYIASYSFEITYQ